MSDLNLENRRIAVTGGASGIGYATAQRLAQAGAHVTLLDRSEAGIQAAVESLRAVGGNVTGVCLDVTNEPAVEAVAKRLCDAHGPYSGLVTSAGLAVVAKAEMTTAHQWNLVMAVNALGTFLCCKAFGTRMIDAQDGAIVALGSIDGLGAHPGHAAYVSSKFAVHGLVRSLAVEWGRHGIRVNAVAPTFVDTPMLRDAIPAAYMAEVADRTPMGRIACPADIVGTIMFLLSDLSRYVTGTVIPVDGGITAGYLTRAQGADLSSNSLLAAGIYEE